jgi:hypothetical protein
MIKNTPALTNLLGPREKGKKKKKKNKKTHQKKKTTTQ